MRINVCSSANKNIVDVKAMCAKIFATVIIKEIF